MDEAREFRRLLVWIHERVMFIDLILSGSYLYLFFPSMILRPLERTFFMCVEEADEQDEEEDKDLNEGRPSHLPDHDGPGIEKYQFYIEDEEDQGEEVVADVELDPGLSGGLDATFISLSFLRVPAGLQDNPGHENGDDGECHGG